MRRLAPVAMEAAIADWAGAPYTLTHKQAPATYSVTELAVYGVPLAAGRVRQSSSRRGRIGWRERHRGERVKGIGRIQPHRHCARSSRLFQHCRSWPARHPHNRGGC